MNQETRHQMRQRIARENPDLKVDSDLFREALVFYAIVQEGDDLQRLSKFLGMSKGEIRRHCINMARKLQACREEINNDGTQIEDATRDIRSDYAGAGDASHQLRDSDL